MTIKTLIFDLDDTLTPDEETADEAILKTIETVKGRYGLEPEELRATVREICRVFWYNSPAREYCVKIGISSWEGLWARFEGDGNDLRILRDWAPTYRKNSWFESLKKFDIDNPDLAVKLAGDFMKNRRQMHRLYDDVQPTLGNFKGKYKLGLLTNGASALQREKIEGAKVGGYFDKIIISGDIDVGKPDPKIFKIMLQELGVTADKAIMIGNSLSSDIKGAQAARIKAVWLNRSAKERDDKIVPDWEISGLGELSSILFPQI